MAKCRGYSTTLPWPYEYPFNSGSENTFMSVESWPFHTIQSNQIRLVWNEWLESRSPNLASVALASATGWRVNRAKDSG